MIEYKNIHLKLGDKQIFTDFSLHISKGEKVLFNAPSGTGKSTLIKMLLGFLKPNQGSIHLDGQALNKSTCHAFRCQCAYVSQDVDLPEVSVQELIDRIFDFKCNRDLVCQASDIERTLAYFDLAPSTIHQNVKDLSGGERQRLGLALCRLMDRPIWLLDEVTSGLDKALKQKVYEMIMESDKTVLIISHDDIWDNESIRKVRWV